MTKFNESDCPRCDGTGYLPQYSHVEGGQCFRCGGSGRNVYQARVRPNKDICLHCNGTGYLPQYSHIEEGKCFRCDGSGRNPKASSTSSQSPVIYSSNIPHSISSSDNSIAIPIPTSVPSVDDSQPNGNKNQECSYQNNSSIEDAPFKPKYTWYMHQPRAGEIERISTVIGLTQLKDYEL